ncbi:cytidylyltransferase [Hirsutella rhossiliensis]|uniref:Cytidylyltransferase n=1 Tax=Hirsutella rhossiliensis TaxID=111463 RepID=A0A9P8N5U9_9HYPO|nr:cytidylyltransferase [Hirsutella rhossiliensis]KAH0966329.1 cytidylyltransferase [Hirsutella rhossiliensis]
MGPNSKQLVDFLSRSLSAFQASRDPLRVLCTLPHHGSPGPRRPLQRVRRLVVLDSSFNPPTRAHARMARAAVREGGPGARLMLLLAVNNADKAPRPASFPVRLGMMEALARGLLLGGVGVEIDVAVTTMAFFHDKARAVAESGFYHDQCQAMTDGGEKREAEPEQVFLVGFDTLVRIFNPKYYNDQGPASSTTTAMQSALGPLFERARLRVTTRPDDAWGSREEQLAYVRGLERLGEVGGRGEWAARVDVAEEEGGTAGSLVFSSLLVLFPFWELPGAPHRLFLAVVGSSN